MFSERERLNIAEVLKEAVETIVVKLSHKYQVETKMIADDPNSPIILTVTVRPYDEEDMEPIEITKED